MAGKWRGTGFGLVLIAPVLAGCGTTAGDFLSKDAEWFSRPARIFSGSDMSMQTPPLTARGPVSPNDLIGGDGACAQVMPTPSENEPAQPAAPAGGGSIALESAECDVVRALGNPDDTNISADGGGNRLAVLTYRQGSRPGIYHFTAGRLTSVERGAEPPPAKKPPRTKKRKAAT